MTADDDRNTHPTERDGWKEGERVGRRERGITTENSIPLRADVAAYEN